MRVVTVHDVLEYEDSINWRNEEVSGVIVQISDLSVIFEKKFIKCVIADRKDHVTVLLRCEKMAEKINKECDKIDHMKITICNFQKNEGMIKTSTKSTVEIDFEELQPVEVETTEAMLYAGIIDLTLLKSQPGNKMVSIRGRVRKIDRKVNEMIPRCILEIEHPTTADFVKITLWREKTFLAENLTERQDVILYHLLAMEPSKDKYKGLAVASLKSSGSSACVVSKSPIEKEIVQLADIVQYDSSERFYDQTVTARLVCVRPSFTVAGVTSLKCVVGHHDIGMPVLIKGHRIIPNLERDKLEVPMKIILTTFQVKDSVLRAERHSIIELDDEDVPEVTNSSLSKLLYAPQVEYKDIQYHRQGRRVSVQGYVRMVWTEEGRTVVVVENQEKEKLRVTFWREQQDLCKDIEIGTKYSLMDLKIGNQEFKGSCLGCVDSTLSTVVHAVLISSQFESSPAKLTGTTDKQVVTRIGQRRVLFNCDDELLKEVEEIIPRKVMIKYIDDKLVSYETLDKGT